MPTSTRTFGTQADDASTGTTAWSNPSNAASSNDTRSTASLGAGGNSHYHKSTNSSHSSGTALSSGDTINSIKYRFERRKSGSPNVRDWKIYPVEGGTIVTTTNFADTGTDWGTSDATAEYTQTTNLPSAATILASNWGVVIACQNTNGFPGGVGELDYVEAIVDFTPGPNTASVAASIGAATAAASATFAPGTKTATVGATMGGATAAASATFPPGTYTASVSGTAGVVTAAASAQHTPPVYSSAVGATAGPAAAAISATHIPPVDTAAIAAAIGAVIVAAVGTVRRRGDWQYQHLVLHDG